MDVQYIGEAAAVQFEQPGTERVARGALGNVLHEQVRREFRRWPVPCANETQPRPELRLPYSDVAPGHRRRRPLWAAGHLDTSPLEHVVDAEDQRWRGVRLSHGLRAGSHGVQRRRYTIDAALKPANQST